MSNTLAVNLNTVLAESGFQTYDQYIGVTDQNVAQIVAIAQATALDLVEDEWMYLTRQGSIVLTSALVYPLPSDWLGFAPNTVYQHGRWDQVDLPTTAEQWALLNSITGMSSLPIRVRLLNNQFNILNPQAGATINFEYRSNAPITNPRAGPVTLFTDDADVWELDDRMFQMQFKWRFKKEKGLEWTADKVASDMREGQVRARDQGNSTITSNQTTVMGVPYTNTWVIP